MLGDAVPTPQFQELWFALQRRPWASLVVVPADETSSAAWIAQSVAAVGTGLHGPAVRAVVAETLDFDSAAELATTLSSAGGTGPRAAARSGQMIVAIGPVIAQPLAIAVARAADGALLCIEKGRTRMASARRTIELIGADRFIGCLMLT
jgi:hypothetical protein